MPGTGYVIKTKDGDKGPFSTEQIGELVAQGKIPPTLKIGDVDAATVVTAQDVIARSATADDQLHDETEASLPPVEERPAPPPTPRGASGRRPRATTRRSGAGAGSGGRAGTSGTRRTRRRKKSSNTPIFIGIGVGVVLLVGIVVFLMNRNTGIPELNGTWGVDPELVEERIAAEGLEPDSMEANMAREMLGQLKFRFNGNRASVTLPGGQSESGTYEGEDLGGGRYRITDPDSDDSFTAEVDGDTLVLKHPQFPDELRLVRQ